MKHKLALILIPLALISLGGCKGYVDIDTGHTVVEGKLVETDHKIKIGILQPVEHVALGLARQGFVDGLKEAGFVNGKNITLDYRNGGGKDADIQAGAKALSSKCELNLGIGTGASQLLKSAQINSGKTTPLLFTAVTDPIDAGLVSNAEKPESFVTGTSDMNPVVVQIDLIQQCLPNATKIGILYTQSETNSAVQANLAKAEAEKNGLQVEIATATNSSDITSAATKLAQTCQAIYIPTDNNIAANMNAVKVAADQKHVLVVTGEEGMLSTGGQITISINYYNLGKLTGKMAASLLTNAKKVADLPVKYMSREDCTSVLSSKNLRDAGITLPQAITSTFTDIDA